MQFKTTMYLAHITSDIYGEQTVSSEFPFKCIIISKQTVKNNNWRTDADDCDLSIIVPAKTSSPYSDLLIDTKYLVKYENVYYDIGKKTEILNFSGKTKYISMKLNEVNK